MQVSKPAVPETTFPASRMQNLVTAWRGFKPGLRFKLLFLITSICLASIVIAALLMHRLQRQQLIRNAQSAAAVLSSALEANLKHAMLINDWEMVHEIVNSVALDENIDTIRILNDQGQVSFSSLSNEIGSRIERTQPVCQSCHAKTDTPNTQVSLYSANKGQQTLLHVNLIQNEIECQACHDPQNRVLGLFLIETPLTQLNEQLARNFWQTLLMALGTFIALTGVILPVLNRSVLRPVEALTKGVTEISAGNLDYQAPLLSNQDELGELARSFRNMQQQLKTTYAEMGQREQELATINDVAFNVTQLLELQDILDFAVDTAVSKLGLDACMIDLLDETTGRYMPRAWRGLSQAQLDDINRRRLAGWDITRQVAESGKELVVIDILPDERFQGIFDDLAGRSYAKLPLISRGMVVGTMGLFTAAGHPMTQQAVEFLKAVGRKIGLAIDNAQLLATTRRREQEASTLYELSTKISASLALHEVLDAVAEAARDLLDADVGLVGLLEKDAPYVVVKAASGMHAEALKGMRILLRDITGGDTTASGGTSAGGTADHPTPTVIHYSDQPDPLSPALLPDENNAALLAVPLKRGDAFLGLVEVISWQPHSFLERDAQLLQRLASHVVVSIENARLYRQLSYMAVLSERERLAREMHDHLAQSLGYLNVKSGITEDLLAAGRIEQAQESLSELKRVAKFVYTDVREAIFNLRTAVSAPSGLLPTLRDYLEEYHQHYGVDVQLLVGCEEDIELAPEVASQALSIIQEALINVRKHAATDKAWVRCYREGEQLCVSITDYGRGFSPTQTDNGGRQHIGLQVMRERAESVGGSLEVDSQPEQGTRVLVRVPGTRPE